MNEYKVVEFYENKSAAQIEDALNTMAEQNYQLVNVIERNGRVVTFLVRPREVKPTEGKPTAPFVGKI
jgi:hypothetical protein